MCVCVSVCISLHGLDLNRTFPENVLFRKSSSTCLQKELYNVLVAYGHHNQAVGYCQVERTDLRETRSWLSSTTSVCIRNKASQFSFRTFPKIRLDI